jgi:hypothetical protein
VNDSLPIRSSKISPTQSRSSILTFLGLLTLSAASLLAQAPETLAPAPADDPKIVHRWTLDGDPHGLAIGSDGTIYAGLAQPQAVVAIDPRTGVVKKRVVLDSAEIASTKELVTLRTNRERTRLYVANGSDESASILALPGLNVVREITMEGEAIRDVVPDPKGRYLYLLGRRVHVFDAKGETELRTIALEDPSAIAATASTLAVAAGKEVVTFDTGTFAERARVTVGLRATSLVLGTDGLVALGADALATGGRSYPICLPTGAGPQAATAAVELVLFAEKRCNSSGPVPGAASLYGVSAYAVAFDTASSTLAATDRAGFLTIYKVPRAAVAK